MPSTNLNVLIDKVLHRDAKIAAIQQGTTISEVVRAALTKLAYGSPNAAVPHEPPHKENP